MALVLADRVQETTTTTGTGTLTLGGAVSGFQSFAVVGNGNTCYYAIVDGSAWEVGIGTYTASGTTLARTTVLSNSLGTTSAITLAAGSKPVFLTYPSERSVNLDASGNVSALGTVASGTWQGTTVGVAYGGTGVVASSGANSVVLRDANQNISINRLNQGILVTTAAGTTTTLTAASAFNQALVGTGGQTYQLPDATTLSSTTAFQFNNNATGTLTIVNNASGAVGTIAPGGAAGIALLSNGTVAGTWDVHAYIPENVTWGTNALALGSTVITGGTWNGGTITSGYGGTGLTTFTGANNALYSTSSSALAAGTLPAAAGGTGLTSFTASGVVYASSTSALATNSALTFDGSGILTVGGAVKATTLGSFEAIRNGSDTAGAGPRYALSNVAGTASFITQLSASNHYTWRYYDGTAYSWLMTLTNSGNLGIGTTSPLTKLQLGTIGSTGASVASGMFFGDYSTSAQLRHSTNNGGTYNVGWGLDASNNFFIGGSTNATGVSPVSWLTVTQAGDLGIGTSSPATKLHVAGTGAFGATGTDGAVSIRRGADGVQVGSITLDNTNAWLKLSTGYGTLIFNANSTDRLTIDPSGNLGLGVTPSAWGGGYKALDINTYAGIAATTADFRIFANAYYNGTNWIAKTTGASSGYVLSAGQHQWTTSASVAAGATVSLSTLMTLTAAGNLGVGTTSPASKLHLLGSNFVSSSFNGLTIGDVGAERLRIGYKNGTPDTGLVPAQIISDTSLFQFASRDSASGAITFATGSGIPERMRLDASGNLGVGTSSPSVASGTGVSIYSTSVARLALRNSTTGDTSTDGSGLFVSGSDFGIENREAGNIIFYNATERMRLDSTGNLGLGVTPSAWNAGNSAIQLGATASLNGTSTSTQLSNNFYQAAAGPKYISTSFATVYQQSSGQHVWYNAPSGTAGNAITFTQAMTLDVNSNLTVAGALLNPTITNYTETTYTANTSTAITLALTNGTVQILTLTANATITMPAVGAGKSFVIMLRQDATGGRSVTWTTVAWPSATAPTITGTASKQDIFSFFSDGTRWYGTTIGQNYTP